MTVTELLAELEALGAVAAEWRLVAQLDCEPSGAPLQSPRRVDVIRPHVDDEEPSVDLVLRDRDSTDAPASLIERIVPGLRGMVATGRGHFQIFISEPGEHDESTGFGYIVDRPARGISAHPSDGVVVVDPWPDPRSLA